MRAASITLCVLACTVGARAIDQSNELTKELAALWSSVTVTMMVDQGCVAPIFRGVRVRPAEGGLTVAVYTKDIGEKDEVEGTAQPVKSFTREEFCAAVLKHYQAGVASEDFSERIAALPTKEEREKAIALAFEAAGHPIGGFSSVGIDIRIVRGGVLSCFDDNFGSMGFDAFQRWINEISPKTK